MLKLSIVALVGCSSPGVQAPHVDERAVTRDTALAINAHVVVLKSRSEFAEYRDVIEKAKKIAGVVSAEPFTISEMTATSAAASVQPV